MPTRSARACAGGARRLFLAALACLALGAVLAGCDTSEGVQEPSGEAVEHNEEAEQKRQEATELARDREVLQQIEGTQREESAEVNARRKERAAEAKAKRREEAAERAAKATEKAAKARARQREAEASKGATTTSTATTPKAHT
jgi:hypothetical protein